MNRKPLAIVGSGMFCGVGLTAASACAAIRCGIDNVQETRFMDSGGEWIMGSSVPLEQPWRGRKKLVEMIVPAIREALSNINSEDARKIPLFLCVAVKERAGRFEGIDDLFLKEVQNTSNIQFHEKSAVIANDGVGAVEAINRALELISQKTAQYCLIAGVDTLLVSGTLASYEGKERLLTSNNSNGFIPGEAGAAILVGPAHSSGLQTVIKGIGFGKEKATIESEEPLRADGLVQAYKEALSSAGLSMGDLDYRITDANGEQYKFKEGDLAVTRLLREHKGEFDIWHPAECIGEVGAAMVPGLLVVVEAAARKGYARGVNVVCHFGNDSGERAAMILTQTKG